MDTEFQLFDGKSFKDLCKDIYTNQEARKLQIETVIGDLRPLIKTPNDAMVIVPLIKGYIDSGNTNDEHLIRLAAIIQKLITMNTVATGEEFNGFGLSEEEKKQLMKEVNAIKASDNSLVKQLDEAK